MASAEEKLKEESKDRQVMGSNILAATTTLPAFGVSTC
jgi:hypothetical protein